jgi:thymidylate synthase
MNVQTIRNLFKQKYLKGEKGSTVSLYGVSFEADEDTIFSEPNQKYIEAEIKWYKSRSKNIFDLDYDPVPAIWREVADLEGNINSNYGAIIFDEKGLELSQYEYVLDILREDKYSRRATMIYTYPEIHNDYKWRGMNDFICTNAVSYYVENDVLNAVVQMRSNDAVYGYKNDLAWQKEVLRMLASDLEMEPGKIIWQVQNLHVYERHYDYLET